MAVGRHHRNRWTGAGPAGRKNRPVGKSARGPPAKNGGYWYTCACGNMTGGYVCSTCSYRDQQHLTIKWCLSCRRPVSGRGHHCRFCIRRNDQDAACRLRQQHGWTHNWRHWKNMTGALAVLPAPDSPPPEPDRPEPPRVVQPFRSPYVPFYRPGRRRDPKVRCGCGRVTVGRYCGRCRRLERDADVSHHCLLCRAPIKPKERRCGRCLAVQNIDESRARHHRDGHPYDIRASTNRTGCLLFRTGGRRKGSGLSYGSAVSLLKFRQAKADRPRAERAAGPEPAHRCSDPEWLGVHGAVRMAGNMAVHGRACCRECGIYFEVTSQIAKICPCCGEEV